MALQLITFRDSPNHKRYGTHCPESGMVTSASGIDLWYANNTLYLPSEH